MKRISHKLREHLYRQTGFEPFGLQREIIEDDSRFKIVAAGRRFGKSLLGAALAMEQMLVPNTRTWIVAPTFDLTDKIWRILYRWCSAPAMRKDVVKKIHNSPGRFRIETNLDSFVEAKSSDNPTSLIGESLDLLVLDEASRVKKDAWETALRPTLSDKEGSAVMISTPLAKNWFYREFMRGKQEMHGYKSWNAYSRANPYFPEREWEAVRSEYGEDSIQFRTEYLAEFLDDGGTVFRNLSRIRTKKPADGPVACIGVDLAQHVDYVACVAMNADGGVVSMDRFNQYDWAIQKRRIYQFWKDNDEAPLVLDATGMGGGVIYDDLKNAGINVVPFVFTGVSKVLLVEDLMAAVDTQKISISEKFEDILYEMSIFTVNITNSGHKKYSHPDGFHDDCVMALGLAWHGVRDGAEEAFFMFDLD